MSLLEKATNYKSNKKAASKFNELPDKEVYEVLEAYINGDVTGDALSMAVTGKKGNQIHFIISTIKRGFLEGHYMVNPTK